MDLRQSLQYANYLSSQGWVVKRIDNTNYFIKNLPIIGSILKIQRPEKVDFKVIDKLCRKHRVFQIILEPKNKSQISSIETGGFKISKNPYLPTKTLQVDLTKSEKEIYADLKRNIRKGLKMGEETKIKVYSTPTELETFQKAWRKSVKFSRYVPGLESLLNLRKSFPQDYSIFLASHNIIGSIISGVIFTRVSHDSVNYMYGFASPEGRTSLAHASLLYQGILWGKKMGCKVFDFEGIYDDRFPNKSWLGFTRFKHSFGGFEVEYPGTYTKLRFPFSK